jgi:hypothetical protein
LRKIDFRHNRLDIASALVEAVMFTRIADPARWRRNCAGRSGANRR